MAQATKEKISFPRSGFIFYLTISMVYNLCLIFEQVAESQVLQPCFTISPKFSHKVIHRYGGKEIPG